MAASQALSQRQRQVWQFIAKWSYNKGYPPTYREIAEGLKMASVSTVVYHLDALVKKGYLRRTDNAARSIELLIQPIPALPRNEQPKPISAAVVRVPIAGDIAASPPIQAHPERGEYLSLPIAMLNGNHDAYILRVRGWSMVEAGIGDGDLVLIQPTDIADNGEIVVACLDNDVTLKRFYREGHQVTLRPANPNYQPIQVNAAQVRIQGRLMCVIRRLSEN
ncbi:MAG: repressor LexA [Candidatus Chloroheliales bacterium]|nr:MAG: repressor LexA [Chloroflexota bacterium]